MASILCMLLSFFVAISASSKTFHTYNGTVPNATLIYNVSSWVEFMAVRPNGQILLPLTTKREIWSYDPSTGRAENVVNLTGPFAGFTGITEIKPDYFAVLSGNFTPNGTLDAGSWGVWTVDFLDSKNAPKNSPIRSTSVQQIPASEFFLAVTPLDKHNVFVADGGLGLLYKVSLATGNYTIASNDSSLRPPEDKLAGIHGVRYEEPYVYYTNTFGGGFWKQEVTLEGVAVGKPVMISPLIGSDRPEGFTVHKDATYISIQKGGIDRLSRNGTSLVYNVEATTDCVFGRTSLDSNVLYIMGKYGGLYKTPPVD